jgi:hypothetical protein
MGVERHFPVHVFIKLVTLAQEGDRRRTEQPKNKGSWSQVFGPFGVIVKITTRKRKNNDANARQWTDMNPAGSIHKPWTKPSSFLPYQTSQFKERKMKKKKFEKYKLEI